MQRVAKVAKLLLMLHLSDLLVVKVVHKRALYWVSVRRAGVNADHLRMLLHGHGASLAGVHGLNVEAKLLEVVEILLVLLQAIPVYVLLLLQWAQAFK